jgi:hypothetical protein
MEPVGGGTRENRQISGQPRPAFAKIRRLHMGWVIEDDDDERLGAPLETGDIPSC